MTVRLGTCASCGAGVTFGHNGMVQGQVCLEPAGFAATIGKTGEVFWQDTFRQHTCQPAAVAARAAWIESVTTEEERQRANDLAAQREMARELAKTFACTKPKCEAPVGEGCVNLTVLNRTGERHPTAWPHPERMEIALKALQATGVGAETTPTEDVLENYAEARRQEVKRWEDS